MRFDYYAATIRDEPTAVLDVLSAGLGATVHDGTARHGYASGFDLKREGSTVARVLAGGKNGHPHAWASSDDTDAFVGVVRSSWPGLHTVTRLDAAEDFDGPGTFDRLNAVLLALADERRLSIDQAGDWHRLEAGRTFYLGGRKSAVYARLYEKGLQLRGRAEREGRGAGGPGLSPGAAAGALPEALPEISRDLTRLELVVRPEGVSRMMAAVMQPEAAYGFSDWSRELVRRVFDLDVERVHIKERRTSDEERAIWFMTKQYAAHLERLAEALGGWEAVGVHLGRVRAAQTREA